MEPRVQQVVLPSLWPRKKNTRGPGSADEDVVDAVKGAERDVREEARREIEEERRRERERREREDETGERADVSGFEEGLRLRNRAYENMPGAMPGMMVN